MLLLSWLPSPGNLTLYKQSSLNTSVHIIICYIIARKSGNNNFAESTKIDIKAISNMIKKPPQKCSNLLAKTNFIWFQLSL